MITHPSREAVKQVFLPPLHWASVNSFSLRLNIVVYNAPFDELVYLCKSDLLNTGNKPDSLKLEITCVKVDLLSTGNKPDSWTLEMNQILEHWLLISQKFIFPKYTVSFITPQSTSIQPPHLIVARIICKPQTGTKYWFWLSDVHYRKMCILLKVKCCILLHFFGW